MGKANLVLFWAIQSTVLLAFACPPSVALLALALVSHYGRMIGITLCFHRHLAHRAFGHGLHGAFGILDVEQEIADAIVWLLSAQSSYTTGAILDVSGGR